MAGHADDVEPRVLQLTPQLLIAAYCQGVFPMARSRHAPTIEWYSPDPRGILPLAQAYGGAMEAHPVSRAVNNVRNNDPSLVDPIDDEE